MLEELGAPYSLKHVAILRGGQFSPEIRKLNPLGKVPAIRDPAADGRFAEPGAIFMRLAEHHDRFLPRGSLDQ